jgi:hypothetical protein
MRRTADSQFRTVARRRAGIGLLVLVLGTLLALDWAGTTPESALTPEAGGPVPGVSAVTRAENSGGTINEAAGQAGTAGHTGREWGHVPAQAGDLEQETNPLDLLVDGPGFIRFLGFTVISLGFAVVVLVFFWSYRSNLRQ